MDIEKTAFVKWLFKKIVPAFSRQKGKFLINVLIN